MKQEYYVDKIEMAPRQNNSNGFAKFKLEGSLNGTDWTLLGDSLVFNPANKSFQEFSITPQPLQYIKNHYVGRKNAIAYINSLRRSECI